ncbi:MAG: hypothetical protein ACRD22_12825 [Terriglobia bacterium]
MDEKFDAGFALGLKMVPIDEFPSEMPFTDQTTSTPDNPVVVN